MDLRSSETITFPINLGSAEKVSINQLVDMVESIAGVKLKRHHNLNAPTATNGRNSDNALIKKILGWEPTIPLRTGMQRTSAWIYDQMKSGKSKDAVVNICSQATRHVAF